MPQLKPKAMSTEEFLAWQLEQDRLYELVDGQPRLPLKMMTGATRNHDRVTVNALGLLFNQLRGKPCRPCTDDIAVQIPAGNIRRPDLLVDCGKGGPKDMLAADPRLVIEVLSPSTMEFDRLVKLEEYKTVPSINTILLINTEAPQTSIHRRQKAGWDFHMIEDIEATIEFADIGAALTLRDLYDGVEFTASRE